MVRNAYEVKKQGVEPQVVVLKVSNMFMINYNYLVIDHISNTSVIIDPAWDIDKIDRAIADSGTRLKGILLTHSHLDHIHLAKPLANKYDCAIWMSLEEMVISDFSAPQLEGIDERPWMVEGLKIKPFLTPGHTAGSMCYLIGNNLFSGDTLFAEGCGLCPDIAAAYKMFESLQTIKAQLRSDTRIFPGHNYGKIPGQEFATILQNNIYLQFGNKQDFASYRLRKGQNHSKFFEFL